MIYHKDIGFPSMFRRPVGSFVLILSKHALARAVEKGFDIPDRINMRDFRVIEIETSVKRVEKIVMRGGYDDNRDIVLVVIPQRNGSFYVKTAWLNNKNDLHFTLDVSKYERP